MARVKKAAKKSGRQAKPPSYDNALRSARAAVARAATAELGSRRSVAELEVDLYAARLHLRRRQVEHRQRAKELRDLLTFRYRSSLRRPKQ